MANSSGNNKNGPDYGEFDPKYVGITSESSLRDMQIEILAQVLSLQAQGTAHQRLYHELVGKCDKLKEILGEISGVQAHHTKELVEVFVKMDMFKRQVKGLSDVLHSDINKSSALVTSSVRDLEAKVVKLQSDQPEKRKLSDDAAASAPAKRVKEEAQDDDLDVTQTLAHAHEP